MIGTVSDVAGTFSATISIKTENATKQVKPSVTFSPEDVGNLQVSQISSFQKKQTPLLHHSYQKDIHVKHDSIAHGMITLNI